MRRVEITILIPDSITDTGPLLRRLIATVTKEGCSLHANHYPTEPVGKAAAWARDLITRAMGGTRGKP